MIAGITAFHKHLDECDHCRDNPFDLCKTGLFLAQLAAADKTVHLLVTDKAACGLLNAFSPEEWPKTHGYVTVDDGLDCAISCEVCKSIRAFQYRQEPV